MKSSILLISSLLALTTCNAKQRVTSPTVKVAPSLTFDSLSVTRSSDTDTLAFSILAVGSTDGHCPAAYSIMEHFSETAGGTFAGNPTADAKQMLDYYADSLHQELLHHPNLPYLRDGIKLFRSLEMTKMAETASYITMSISSESFDGGAHGMRTTEGFTVRKSDGRILGNEIFRPFKDEQQRDAWNIIVRQQLQKELLDKLLFFLFKLNLVELQPVHLFAKLSRLGILFSNLRFAGVLQLGEFLGPLVGNCLRFTDGLCGGMQQVFSSCG